MKVQPSRRTYAITLFLILLVCYGYFLPKWADWGANSRADLVYAFGDAGVLYIDAYNENTGDKACFPGPFAVDPADNTKGSCSGHYFTDKSLGPSLVALPFYLVFKGIAALPPVQRFIESGKGIGSVSDTLDSTGEGITPRKVYEYMALTFITFFASAVPSALLGVVFFLMVARFARKDSYAFLLALAFGLGTIAFPYSNALYQHQLAAFGMFVGFYLLYRVIYEQANLRWLWAVGLLFSFVAITEYPAIPMLAIIFLWAVYKMPNRMALYRVVIAGLPMMILFAAFNYAMFQTPIPVGYKYSTNWQGEHTTGFMSLEAPSLKLIERFYGLTLSPVRGIFLLEPFLLLAIPSFYWMWRERKDRRDVLVVIGLIVAAFMFYNSSSSMWWGGHTIGPRYLVPMLPFFCLPIIFALNHLLEKRWGRVLTGVLIVLSFLIIWAMLLGGQLWPPVSAFPVDVAHMTTTSPLVEYTLPMLQQGNITRNLGQIVGLRSFMSVLPLLVIIVGIYLLVPRWLNRREQQTLYTAPLKRAESTH
jgi:hypothetical protein